MYSEQLAIMLFLAAVQANGPQAGPFMGPTARDARHAMIQAVKEPELVAALTLRASKAGKRPPLAVPRHTLLASAE